MVLWLTENMSLVKLHVLLLNFASLGYVRVLFPTSGGDPQILTRSIFPCWDPHTPGISRHGTPPNKNGQLVYSCLVLFDVYLCCVILFIIPGFVGPKMVFFFTVAGGWDSGGSRRRAYSLPWQSSWNPSWLVLPGIRRQPCMGTNPCKLKNYVKRNISQNNHWLDSWSLRFLGVTCSVYIYLFDCVCVSS